MRFCATLSVVTTPDIVPWSTYVRFSVCNLISRALSVYVSHMKLRIAPTKVHHPLGVTQPDVHVFVDTLWINDVTIDATFIADELILLIYHSNAQTVLL